ncbi:uncharacterized protein BROUX77_003912 [Berkeleyomyces rouxiae]|uniref:uncharacterized protein n=1 Tax=Berkeleyomyces rouxiae TaxID=2035830 RepID=UPI003B7A9BD0
MRNSWNDDMTLASAIEHVADRIQLDSLQRIENAVDAYQKLYDVSKKKDLREYCKCLQHYRKLRQGIPDYMRLADPVLITEAFLDLRRHHSSLEKDPMLAKITKTEFVEDLPQIDQFIKRLLDHAPPFSKTYTPTIPRE